MRAVLQIVVPLLAPFVFYSLFLVVENARRARRRLPPLPFGQAPFAKLAITGVALAIASFLLLTVIFDEDAAPGGSYIPPHMENGRVVPGRILPGQAEPPPPRGPAK